MAGLQKVILLLLVGFIGNIYGACIDELEGYSIGHMVAKFGIELQNDIKQVCAYIIF